MIGLIERHCVNDLLIHVRDVFRGISRIDPDYRALIQEIPGKSLSETLLSLDMPDYLDGIDSYWCFSCPSYYQEKGFGFLPVCDLLAFRHVLMGITGTGAVALGSRRQMVSVPSLQSIASQKMNSNSSPGHARNSSPIKSSSRLMRAFPDARSVECWKKSSSWRKRRITAAIHDGGFFVFDKQISKKDALETALGQVTVCSLNSYQPYMEPTLFAQLVRPRHAR